MGQALRRAAGRAPASGHRPPAAEPVRSVERRTPVVPNRPEPTAEDGQDHVGISDPESIRITKKENIVDERDSRYDAMLSKMVGKITTKPGGKLEMGEAHVVEKYNRPLPRLRSSKAEISGDGQKSAPPGTLTAVQLQQIILMYQGKSEQHQGPMTISDIVKKFGIDAAHVESIVRFISMPPENNTKSNK